MRAILATALLLAACGGGADSHVAALDTASHVKLEPSEPHFEANVERVYVRYSGMPGEKGEWLGITRRGSSSATLGGYHPTGGEHEGEAAWPPMPAGEYVARAYAAGPDDSFVVLATSPIIIVCDTVEP